MRRILHAAATDVRLQIRYGLYLVSGLMVLIWGALLGALARTLTLDPSLLVTPLVALNLIITTFYFAAALVLFERGEGTLAAMAMTPLGELAYLMSKALTLGMLAAAETLFLVALLFGGDLHWPGLTAGTMFLGILYALSGVLAVTRFDSMTRFLMPSVAVVIVLILPLLAHVGLINSWVAALHPAGAAMILIADASGRDPAFFARIAAWVAAPLWCAIFLFWSRAELRRLIGRSV